jgi:hypothetical protein
MASNRHQQPTRRSSNTHNPPPYNFVSFPNEDPSKQSAVGHKEYLPEHLHGSLSLELDVKTAVHSATGTVATGREVNQPRIGLIKTMVQRDEQPIIQGSSLKGCIRSIYEAITNSRLGVIPSKGDELRKGKYPENRLPCSEIGKLCPASAVFGASGEKWGWRSLVEFQDAHCKGSKSFETGFMPSLWSPRREGCDAYFHNDEAVGRKFYYHMTRALDKGSADKGIPVQQAGQTYQFITKLRFKNLKPEEVGALLIALGQDSNFPLALKIGGGKPIGMGTMTVKVTEIILLNDFQSYYSSYNAKPDCISGQALELFIANQIEEAKEKELVQPTQLQEMYSILGYGKEQITRQPYEQYSWKPRR